MLPKNGINVRMSKIQVLFLRFVSSSQKHMMKMEIYHNELAHYNLNSLYHQNYMV